jgi:hypothetical protein
MIAIADADSNSKRRNETLSLKNVYLSKYKL